MFSFTEKPSVSGYSISSILIACNSPPNENKKKETTTVAIGNPEKDRYGASGLFPPVTDQQLSSLSQVEQFPSPDLLKNRRRPHENNKR